LNDGAHSKLLDIPKDLMVLERQGCTCGRYMTGTGTHAAAQRQGIFFLCILCTRFAQGRESITLELDTCQHRLQLQVAGLLVNKGGGFPARRLSGGRMERGHMSAPRPRA
jgi:hypothetical protein